MKFDLGDTGVIVITTDEDSRTVTIAMTFATGEDAVRAGKHFSAAARNGVLELRLHTGDEIKEH